MTMTIPKVSWVLMALLLTMPSCYPPDMTVDIPHTSRDLRIFCEPECPDAGEISAALEDVMHKPCFSSIPNLGRSISRYGLTWSEEKFFRTDGQQIWGITWHNSTRQYIYSPHPKAYENYRWELSLVALERLLPGSGEGQKIEHFRNHCEREKK